ncbi:MAG: molybdopterin biosynthesis protein [Nitrospirota bacterium]|nr:MAG: molybdopterin biosynthesis protein [Nitrospirota bacterium]
MSKKIYLDNMPLEDARGKWFAAIAHIMDKGSLVEDIMAEEALHRVTAEAVNAKISSPFYHSSAMDGYAVNYIDTFGATESAPILLQLGKKAACIDTGDPMPQGTNAVIKVEDANIVSEKGEDRIELISPVTPWQNVRVIGEDIVVTDLILPENTVVRPVDLSAMLAGGIKRIKVRKRATVNIIPTGDEIVDYKKEMLKEGEIIDTNTWMLDGYIKEDLAIAVRGQIVPDDKERLRFALGSALRSSDIVLIIAGSSAGSEDYTADVIRDMGEVIVHGVGIRPGKPVVLGIVDEKPVIGIPGYPVSAFLAYKLFVRPILQEYYLDGAKEPEIIEARLSRQLASPIGMEEFVRVKLGNVADKIIATPVTRGAGVIMSLVRADGLLRIPERSEGYGAGTDVCIELIRSRKDIKNTIVGIGSHDNSLDLMANYLKRRYPELSLSSAHTGSMGGIMAIKKGEAHIAGTHLLDEASGEYNVPFIREHLSSIRLRLYNLVYREQGLIVKKGNPKNIKGIEDLIRDDVTFVNRQSGSGTRLLTDKSINDIKLDSTAISGYDRVEFTHMSVASAVRGGIADAGMGIYAASVALDLDFIPVARERYDIIIPQEHESSDKIMAFLDIMINDEAFRSAVEELGGYDTSDMGRVMYEQ